MPTSEKVIIKMVSDFVCPWCLIADTRLNKAIAETGAEGRVERVWVPYELNPHMPEEGIERREYRSAKFGSWERSLELDAQVKAVGEQDGIAFRHDLMQRAPNTRKAHRLTWIAARQGKASAVAERILEAYFLGGLDIGDAEILADLAEKSGINKARVMAFLASGEGVEEVQAIEMENVRRGVQSVPLTVIGDQIISGAQHVQVFADAIIKTLEQKEKASSYYSSTN